MSLTTEAWTSSVVSSLESADRGAAIEYPEVSTTLYPTLRGFLYTSPKGMQRFHGSLLICVCLVFGACTGKDDTTSEGVTSDTPPVTTGGPATTSTSSTTASTSKGETTGITTGGDSTTKGDNLACAMHHQTCMDGFATANGCDLCVASCEEGSLEYKECKVFLDCLGSEMDACACAHAACSAEVIVCDECAIACNKPCP